MLFINFARCRSFDSADLMRNANIADANDNIDLSNLIRECENISLLDACVCCSLTHTHARREAKIKD